MLSEAINYQKEQIVIRIESIKNELDVFLENFNKNLDEIEIEIHNEIENLSNDYDNICNKNENLLNDINLKLEDINENQLQLVENIYKCESSINEIKNLNKLIKSKLHKVRFSPNDDWKFDIDYIGYLKKLESNDFEMLKVNLPYKIDLNEKHIKLASGMATIDNETLLIVDSQENEIVLFDKKFECVDRIKHVDEYTFNYPINICTDGHDTVYLCDYNNNRVLLIDKNFDQVKKSITTAENHIENPIDICFYGDCLFILDNMTSNIKQFLSDGEFVRDINLVNQNGTKLASPVRLSIKSELIAVLDDWRFIYLYDFDGNFKISIIASDDSINTIYFHSNNLYSLTPKGIFSCYKINSNNPNNYTVETLFERYIQLLDDSSDFMTIFNNKLIIVYCYSNFLAIFDLN